MREIVIGYSDLNEFVDHSIKCYKNTQEEFKEWLSENKKSDSHDKMIAYTTSSMDIFENRLKQLEFAKKQLIHESDSKPAIKELEIEISLRKNVLLELSKSGVIKDTDFFTPSNTILIFQQMLEDDILGEKRENYGVPFLQY